MALSNYSSILFNASTGEQVSEVLTPQGITAYIYKDWLYIKEENKTVMEVREGKLWYKDLSIYAEILDRTFYVALSSNHKDYFVGLARYAYDGDEYNFFEEEEKEKLIKWVWETDAVKLPFFLEKSEKSPFYTPTSRERKAALNKIT